MMAGTERAISDSAKFATGTSAYLAIDDGNVLKVYPKLVGPFSDPNLIRISFCRIV
jgi:hypothetical protein